MTRPPRVLSVAGSDPSGGAGVQADLKAISALGGYAMAAVTALTAQSPRGVRAVFPVPADAVAAQLDVLLAECPPDAVKVGMLGSVEVAQVVGSRLAAFPGPVVLDPVLVATSGDALAEEGVVGAIRELLPVATLVTPNLPEAGVLASVREPGSREEMTAAGEALRTLGAQAVLVKGGHLSGDGPAGEVADVLVDSGGAQWFSAPRVPTGNTHGTGCSLSSALAALLARGLAVPAAVAEAKAWLTGALAAADQLGEWGPGAHGPVHHFWRREQP